MSHPANDIYIEHHLESFEDLTDCSFVKFEEMSTEEKFLVLYKTPGTNAKAAIRNYLSLKEIL